MTGSLRRCSALVCAFLMLTLTDGFVPAALALDGKPDKVVGLIDSFGSPGGASRPKLLRVLLIHGIGPHSVNWSARLQRALVRELHGFSETKPADGADLQRYLIAYNVGAGRSVARNVTDYEECFLKGPLTPECRNQLAFLSNGASDQVAQTFLHAEDMPTLYVRHYRDASLNTLSVYELTWSPITERRRRAARRLDGPQAVSGRASKPTPAPLVPKGDEGAWFNRAIKQGLIENRLSDVVMYLGHERDNILAVTKDALCRVWTSTAPSDVCDPSYAKTEISQYRYSIITESLGSRIAFDALSTYDAEGFADDMVGNAGAIYMLANQLPLLELASEPGEQTDGRPKVQTEKFDAWLAAQEARQGQAPPPSLQQLRAGLDASLCTDMNSTIAKAEMAIPTDLEQHLELARDHAQTLQAEDDAQADQIRKQTAALEENAKQREKLAQLTADGQGVGQQRQTEATAADGILTQAVKADKDARTAAANRDEAQRMKASLSLEPQQLARAVLQIDGEITQTMDAVANLLESKVAAGDRRLLRKSGPAKDVESIPAETLSRLAVRRLGQAPAASALDIARLRLATSRNELSKLVPSTAPCSHHKRDQGTCSAADLGGKLQSIDNLARQALRDFSTLCRNTIFLFADAPAADNAAWTTTCRDLAHVDVDAKEQVFRGAEAELRSANPAQLQQSIDSAAATVARAREAAQAKHGLLTEAGEHVAQLRTRDDELARQGKALEAELAAAKSKRDQRAPVLRKAQDEVKRLEADRAAYHPTDIYALNGLMLKSRAFVHGFQKQAIANRAEEFADGAVRQLLLERAGERENWRLPIFALSDPSDILSYVLSDAWAKQLQYVDFVNVRISLTLDFFGLVANPLTAHSGFDHSRRTARLIACGGEIVKVTNGTKINLARCGAPAAASKEDRLPANLDCPEPAPAASPAAGDANRR
jgi:hypothetical protein